VTATVRELDVAPLDPRIGERTARRLDAHREAADPFVAAERVDARADDGDRRLAHVESSSGANAYDATPA
jgi:hypothetical protein